VIEFSVGCIKPERSVRTEEAPLNPKITDDSLLKEVPDLKLILAHAGFPVYRETWERIKGNKNVSVDLSQTSYVGNGITKAVVGYLGVERCLFGTDGPFGFYTSDGKFDYGFIKRRIERLFPDKGVQKKLLGDNFATLTGIQ
ncbi:MAG: amidohydrolase, partial [Deltaproteobacteria bacterium]|nr:amidohydrolase [Deltaproteobacteria bacterium]